MPRDAAQSPTIDDQITEIEARIEQLQQRWKPYARVQPVGEQAVPNIAGGRYDPTLLLEKQELSFQIDDAKIELATLRRRRAEQHLAAMEDDLNRTVTDLEVARTTHQEAKAALQAAALSLGDAQQAHDMAQERRARLEREQQQAIRDEKAWRAERTRDEAIKENASRVTRVYSMMDGG